MTRRCRACWHSTGKLPGHCGHDLIHLAHAWTPSQPGTRALQHCAGQPGEWR